MFFIVAGGQFVRFVVSVICEDFVDTLLTTRKSVSKRLLDISFVTGCIHGQDIKLQILYLLSPCVLWY
jgi:hypothetical protein